jgi:hypothetical protein
VSYKLYQHWRLSSSARDVRMFGMVIWIAQEKSGYVCQNEPAMAEEISQKTSVKILCSSLERD